MSPTIVTLAPLDGQSGGVTTVISSSFEEAFGEFSEMRGRGRKRRNNRKTERQQNRIGRRKLRKKSRQEIRDDQMESRQGRKTHKRGHKLRRKSMGDQEHGDEQRPDEQPSESRPSEEGYSSNSQEQSNEPTQSTSQESDSSQEQQGYEENQGQSSDDYQSDDSQNDDSQDSGSQDEEQSSDSSDSGFDGIMGAEDRFSEMNDEGKIRVHPSVKDTAKKIEWNKEKISRLRKRSEYLKTQLSTERNQVVKSQMNREIGDVSREAKEHIDRVHELESKLTKYTNFEGEFSGADGQFSEVRGGKHGKGSHLIKGRHREVSKARKEAQHERTQITKDKIAAIKNKRHPHGNKNHGGCETPVEGALAPEMSEQRIEVPAVSNFYGTGLNGIDLQDDYDAPPARVFELKSNADGDKPVAKKLNYKAIAIGVGVALVAIWAIKKYKILGSE